MKRLLSLSHYLSRTGGWYIIIAVAIAQLSSIPAKLLGNISISFNTELSLSTLSEISRSDTFFMLFANLIILGVAWYLTPTAQKRLNDWATNQLKQDPKEELLAWTEITAITWRYGTAGLVITYIVGILPPALSAVRNDIIKPDQFIYILLGGLIAALTTIFLSVLMIDRILAPARLVLVPKSFDAQLTGLAGPRLNIKFQVLILILVVVSILLVGPVGFHFMSKGLTEENQFLRQTFQGQVMLVAFLALAVGAGLAFLVSQTISNPLRELIETFKAVEAGDLSQRVNITATDEIAEVSMHFNHIVTGLQELRENLEKQVADRTRLLKATNEVAKVSSSILDPDLLLAKVINLFTDQFNYYYAAIYLLDPGEKWAELKEATGEAGKVLKQNHHRVELAGKNMVAVSIREKMPRISQNTLDEKQRPENPLLPYTRSEIALPLLVGDRILGALNVQSTRIADFGLEAIETMQNMATQVAIALENAHLFQETELRINEMRAIQQQYLTDGWSSLTMRRDEMEYGIGESNEANTQKFVSQINLRDQIIGQIAIEGTIDWTTEQKNLVDAVATQAAVALENARLVNESRQIASRERMLAEINSKIWSSTTIDAVLQTTIKELGRRFDASSATIELKLDNES